MATFAKATDSANLIFTPISSALGSISNTAGTLAALFKATGSSPQTVDLVGTIEKLGDPSAWYHTIDSDTLTTVAGSSKIDDDDGIIGSFAQFPSEAFSFTDWYIFVVTWAAGTVTERMHYVNVTGAGSWVHFNANANNGGSRAGPGTQGRFQIGFHGDFNGPANIALGAAWAGTALSDSQIAELSVNKRTSDWWNCSGGNPTTLIECTSLSPTDIGADPATFFGTSGSPTLTGADPPGWTFDGRGSGVAAADPTYHSTGLFGVGRV